MVNFILSKIHLHSPNNATQNSGFSGHGPPLEARRQKLDMLLQTLKIAENAVGLAHIPAVQGSISLSIQIIECIQGYRANNDALDRLAFSSGKLMMEIAQSLQSGVGLPASIKPLVDDLHQALERVYLTAKAMVERDHWARRLFAQTENARTINILSKEVDDARLTFLTRGFIANAQIQEQSQDPIYDRRTVLLDSEYATGNMWRASLASLSDTQEVVIVKSFEHTDMSERMKMHSDDIRAFKRNWHANLLQFIGRSHPNEEYPYIVLRGVTSAHVSEYIGMQFAESSQRGSVEALRLLKDLTNAFVFVVQSANASLFDISSVHLNESGNVVIVNLEPTSTLDISTSDSMPHWNNWQVICIELLTGDAEYEPNPSIDHVEDSVRNKRLEYLRPILGHIHQGGARFQEVSIEAAFRKEGKLLARAHHDLGSNVRRNNPDLMLPPVEEQVLRRAMWHDRSGSGSRELHYVAHFKEPLVLDVGDIGYVTGDPPSFVALKNVRAEISDGFKDDSELPVPIPLRFEPKNRWRTETIGGVIRHAFRFMDADMNSMSHWRLGRPRLQKDFLLRRLNLPDHCMYPELVVDSSKAWKALEAQAAALAWAHKERDLTPNDLILVVYFKQQSGYATFRLNKPIASVDQWRQIWLREGLPVPPEVIYFYEQPPGGAEGVWGYFSFSPQPGTPHFRWTPEQDDAGQIWGWTFQSEDWTVEISKLVPAILIVVEAEFCTKGPI
ncbi:hypothetical protein C8F01DRAFT_1162617 [Mycena amicta]|nr:hypothetical protein C8F01DRAFT_1162617 [Mycena amicta]